MEEQLISFETAKLAKEKGYRPNNPSTEYVPMYYINEEDNTFKLSDGQQEDWDIDDRYLAITQSLLQRWLREEHRIDMVIQPYKPYEDYVYDIDIFKLDTEENCIQITHCSSYEEALEKGLQEALKLI